MQNHYTTKGKHLTIDSRRLIERWKKAMEKRRKSNREIASLLGKVPQTIHTEIKRGTILQNVLEKGASKRFILPTMLNSLMKTIASARSRNQD
ncbi:Mobile element protein [Streptococcus mitis]|uniref:Mobile element protein n=1 Tax=Streptococcus mitis TaxID=28037 RepID=A0A139Q4U0_STRMT|nr:Mobile element protein [Streptococcus mitis]